MDNNHVRKKRKRSPTDENNSQESVRSVTVFQGNSQPIDPNNYSVLNLQPSHKKAVHHKDIPDILSIWKTNSLPHIPSHSQYSPCTTSEPSTLSIVAQNLSSYSHMDQYCPQESSYSKYDETLFAMEQFFERQVSALRDDDKGNISIV
mmetsp:Transcript_21524/g.31268  ORF Transcript_21524/g.31268 Transcript_21524/m.31268 type:complete len:148 (-) Transcript_21524:239-682(-)